MSLSHAFVSAAPRLARCGLLLLAALVSACSPALNWREVRPDGTRLAMLLPCKPDKAEKTVPLGGKPTSLSMLGCTSGDAVFAVSVADIGEAGRAAEVLAQWQALTLANMKATPASTRAAPFVVPSAAGTPVPQFATLVQARGQHADGRPVEGRALYFAQGSRLFQVVLYDDKPDAGLAETFFAGLKLQ